MAESRASSNPCSGEDNEAAPLSADGRTEIAGLSEQIASWRAQLGLPSAPTTQALSSADVDLGQRSECADRASSQRCEDVCHVSSSICSAAARICELAEELADDWSAERCESARASCTDARERCCDCIAGEPATR